MLQQTWMESFFLNILNMSLTGSLVILAVLLVRLLLKRAPKIFSYMLWAVVLFRLLCPVSFPSTFSFLQVVPEASARHGQMEYLPEGFGSLVALQIVQSESDVAASTDVTKDVAKNGAENVTGNVEKDEAFYGELSGNVMETAEKIVTIGTWIWILGILAMAAYSGSMLLKLRRKLRSAVKEEKNIYLTDQVTTPFVYGIVRPKIYLPSFLQPKEKEYILLHEKIHIRRGDHIAKMAAYMALCLHWFNPLVWIAFFLSGKDMEMSCDEAVLRKSGDTIKKEYSTSLLVLSSGKRIVGGIPLAFGEGETGSRIKNILHYKKPAVAVSAVTVIICVIIAIPLLANPQNDTGSEMLQEVQAETKPSCVYGVIMDIPVDEEMGEGLKGKTMRIVRVPGIGDLEVPKAEQIYSCFDSEKYELSAGDLVKITFSEEALYDEEGNYTGIEIMESYPGAFGTPVESIVCLGRQSYLDYAEDGKYLLALPTGFILNTEAGDTIEIYHHSHTIDGQQEELLASGVLKETEWSAMGELSVELNLEQVRTYLSEFGFGIRYRVISHETGLEVEDLGWELPNYNAKQLGEEIVEVDLQK